MGNGNSWDRALDGAVDGIYEQLVMARETRAGFTVDEYASDMSSERLSTGATMKARCRRHDAVHVIVGAFRSQTEVISRNVSVLEYQSDHDYISSLT